MKKLLSGLALLLMSTSAFAVPYLKITAPVDYLATNASTTVTFTASEAITGFTAADVLVSFKYNQAGAHIPNATVTNFTTVSPAIYTATVTNLNRYGFAVMVNEGSYTGASGAGANATYGFNRSLTCHTKVAGKWQKQNPQPVFLKIGEKLNTGSPNYVTCHRYSYDGDRNLFYFSATRQKPILLGAGQSVVPDATLSTAQANTHNSVHYHAKNTVKALNIGTMGVGGKSKEGFSTKRIKWANHDTYNDAGQPVNTGHTGLNGSARISALEGRYDNFDVIVAPGQKSVGHCHAFFGNLGINYLSTSKSLRESGNTTIAGGTANRTLYWSPCLIDIKTGEIVPSTYILVYYKRSVAPKYPLSLFPNGLKIISGKASNAVVGGNSGTKWGCSSVDTGADIGTPSGGTSYIPSCGQHANLKAEVIFPECWDGVNLDSVDHASHMAYAEPDPDEFQQLRCPATHPVALAKITVGTFTRIPPLSDTSTFMLSSDGYGFENKKGLSLHQDWMNGWNQEIFQEYLDSCQNANVDCGVNYKGLSKPIAVTSITRSGTTATVTTPAPHKLTTGINIVVSGANQAEYNGNTIKTMNVASLTCAANIVSVNLETPPPNFASWEASMPFIITGASPSGFNGSWLLKDWSTASDFRYAVPSCPASSATGTITMGVDNKVPKNTVTVTSPTTFTYQVTGTPATPATGTITFRGGEAFYE